MILGIVIFFVLVLVCIGVWSYKNDENDGIDPEDYQW